MSLAKSALHSLIAGAVAATLSHAAMATEMDMGQLPADKEKCFGVVKAGKNDCAAANGKHACMAHAETDASGQEFIVLPKGVCEKLTGGSLTPFDAAPAQAQPEEKKG